MSRSSDDGGQWEPARDITHQVKKEWMRFLGTGPGSGIQLRSGEHAGRLLVPVYFNNSVAPGGVYSSGVIFSDDGGQTWELGGSPNDGRVIDGVTITTETMTTRKGATHEPTIVENERGEIVMYMRNPGPKILRSVSSDGGATFSAPVAIPDVPDIFSQPNAIHITSPEVLGSAIVFSNASKRFLGDSGRRNERGRGVLRISEDGGNDFDYNRVFRPGSYVYSSMTELPNGNIGLLWEMEWDGIYYSEVPVSWIRHGRMR